jgi:hypothetical protein
MFKCAITQKCSKPYEKPTRLVVETREKVYHGWRLNPETEKMEYVEVGKGSEIVKEIIVSDEGLKEWKLMCQEVSNL